MIGARDSFIWQPVRNVSGAPIAACSLVACVGVDADGTLQVDVPQANSQTQLFVTDFVPLETDAFGQVHRQFPTTLGYDPSDGSPDVGTVWGVLMGNVLLRSTQTGYVILGRANNGLVVVDVAPTGM